RVAETFRTAFPRRITGTAGDALLAPARGCCAFDLAGVGSRRVAGVGQNRNQHAPLVRDRAARRRLAPGVGGAPSRRRLEAACEWSQSVDLTPRSRRATRYGSRCSELTFHFDAAVRPAFGSFQGKTPTPVRSVDGYRAFTSIGPPFRQPCVIRTAADYTHTCHSEHRAADAPSAPR